MRPLLPVLGFVLLLRLPFLNQAFQGDDVYYLAAAQHAQIEPLHPNNVKYVFLGREVDMRGHSHPPLNAWHLALLLRVFGNVREVPFHAAYLVFSLLAAAAMWSLARRYSPHPVWAALLFAAAPAFVINGTSLESDLPFLAYWMAAVALFASGRYGWAALAAALSACAAYQSVFLTPVLGLHAWLFDRKNRRAWAAALAAPAALAGLQIFERLSTGALPAAVLNGYFQSYGFQAMEAKLRSAAMLTIHACWSLVFPALIPPAILLSWKRRDRETLWLAGWLAIFFAGALIVFFAGSARYLLPMAAPAALLASRLRPKLLAAGFAAQLAISLALAWVNYRHWDGYREFAHSIRFDPKAQRVWINGDWGLRFYLESAGAAPLLAGQPVEPGDMVVTSELADPVHFTTGGGALAPVKTAEIRPSLPLRLIGLASRSGYSTVTKGFLPFGVEGGPIDRLRAEAVVERKPVAEYLPMNAPEAPLQIVSGIYENEGQPWRWTAERAVILLKTPERPAGLELSFTIHSSSPAREVSVQVDGTDVARRQYPAPGSYVLKIPARQWPRPSCTVSIAVDRAFSVPGDHRVLGLVLSGAGFR